MNGAWGRYAAALDELNSARRAVVDDRSRADARVAVRREVLAELATATDDRRERLQRLAVDLRAPLPTAQLTPLPGAPALPWTAGEADARGRLTATDDALEEARRVGRLPLLLPQWTSQLARAAMVYALASVPAAVLVALTFRVKNNGALEVWFGLILPVVTAIVGAAVVGRVSRPRLPEADTDLLVTRLRPPRAHPWLGFLICLAASYLTQQFLELALGPT